MIEQAKNYSGEPFYVGLERYLSENEFDAYLVMLITGIEVNGDYDLGQNVRLISPILVPDEGLKMAAHDSSLGILPYPEYSGALIIPFKHPKYHCIDENIAPHTNILQDLFELLNDARLCITLSKESGLGVQGIGSTVITSDTVPNLADKSWKVLSIKSTRKIELFDDNDANNAKDNFSLFLALTSQKRDHIRVPIAKLNDYLASESLIDGAISLRTALESLFLDPSANQELSHRVSIRAALLLGSSFSERQEIYDTIKKAYNFGSKAVHTGRVKNTEGMRETLDFTAELVIRAIHILLASPNIEWKRLELGYGN